MPVIASKGGVEREFSCAAWDMMPSGKNGYTLISSDCISSAQNTHQQPYAWGASPGSVAVKVLSVDINAVANGLSVNATTGNIIITMALASGSTAGAMSASDFTKLANATNLAVFSTLVMRDASGNFRSVTPVNASDVAIKSYVDTFTNIAGSGLTKTLFTYSVNVDNSTIEISSNALRIKDSGVTGAKLNSAIFGGGLSWASNVLSVTGYTPISGATIARKYTAVASLGGGTGVTVTHNLGTVDVIVQVRNYSTLAEVECDITTTTNTVVVTALGSSFNAYIIIIG